MEHNFNNKINISAKIIGVMTTAFILVGALAWNDASRSLIEHIMPTSTKNINVVFLKILYAIVITIIIIILVVAIQHTYEQINNYREKMKNLRFK